MDYIKAPAIETVIVIALSILGISYKDTIISLMGLFEIFVILFALGLIGLIWVYYKALSIAKELKEKIILTDKIISSHMNRIGESNDLRDEVVNKNIKNNVVVLGQIFGKKIRFKDLDTAIIQKQEDNAQSKYVGEIIDLKERLNKWESI